MDQKDELATILRPAGGGVFLVSTGRAEALEVQKAIYGVDSQSGVDDAFGRAIESIAGARAVIMVVPSDVGAGFRRGANLGPAAMRRELLNQVPEWREMCAENGIVDIGDVFVVPQLLHDDMLNEEQLEHSRFAVYGSRTRNWEELPVSPLSIAERALDLVLAINPDVIPIVLGGDHSCAWPVVSALHRARKDRLAVVQPDAHTDLLAERLGVKYCFATWSYHANELFDRDGRMVQVGIRASGKDKTHWESTLGVKQFWAEECLSAPEQAIEDIVGHLHRVGAQSLYFSNDIDGTDARYADATGTPEPGGLEPDWLVHLIRRLGDEFNIAAGDIMEVAPPLSASTQTTSLAVRYVRETLAAALGKPSLRAET